MSTLAEKLKKFAESNNIIIGWCKAEPFEELRESLEKQYVPFVNYSLEERINPLLTMESAKSIVAMGLSYKKIASKPCDDTIRGAVSVGAVGTDYHRLVMDILEKIKNEVLFSYENMLFVDTGPMVDRHIAYKCGLGFYGKHGNIINEEIGSMFFIGYMLTSGEITPYCEPLDKECIMCRKCIDACPGHAIGNEGFDYSKCVSYLTQCKDELTKEQKKIMGVQIYGCDVCQRVCPYNKDFQPVNSDEAFPGIEEILNLSNKQFKNKFGMTAAGWRGKKIIQRNAEIALENMNTDEAKNILKKFRDKQTFNY